MVVVVVVQSSMTSIEVARAEYTRWVPNLVFVFPCFTCFYNFLSRKKEKRNCILRQYDFMTVFYWLGLNFCLQS